MRNPTTLIAALAFALFAFTGCGDMDENNTVFGNEEGDQTEQLPDATLPSGGEDNGSGEEAPTDNPEHDPRAHEGDDPGECSDGADNDIDGDFDCNDSGCYGAPVCQEEDPADDPTDDPTEDPEEGEELDCGDDVDNDFDGLFDCWDPDCIGDWECEEDEEDPVDDPADDPTEDPEDPVDEPTSGPLEGEVLVTWTPDGSVSYSTLRLFISVNWDFWTLDTGYLSGLSEISGSILDAQEGDTLHIGVQTDGAWSCQYLAAAGGSFEIYWEGYYIPFQAVYNGQPAPGNCDFEAVLLPN